MNNPRRFWKDEWALFIIVGLVFGFLSGRYYTHWSNWLKGNPNENKTSPTQTKNDHPPILQLSHAQILTQAQKNTNKICVIGIDGATWNVMLPMINSGKLPNISKLMENGTYGNLSSLPISLSPVIWTSIATGKVPDKHGIHGFIEKTPDGYEQIPVTSDMRRVNAIWNILSEFEKKVGIISWWVTRPPEKVNGFMVSDGFQMHRFTYPENLYKEYESKFEPSDSWFAKQIGFYTSYKYDPNYKKKYELDSPDYFYQTIMQYLHDFALKDYYSMVAFQTLYSKEKPDFFGIYFPSVDVMSHFAWKFMEPKSVNENFDVTPKEQQLFGQIIPRTYEKVDQYIGEIVKMLPPDTIIMVVSDHGFEAGRPGLFYHWINLNKLLQEMHLLEYTPDHEFDWSKTTVYELEDLTRQDRVLYLNMKGREPMGIVEPKDYEKTRQSIRDQLLVLKTPNNVPLFKEIKIPQASHQYIDSTSFKYKSDYYYGGVSQYTGDLYAVINPDLTKQDSFVIGNKKLSLSQFMIPHPQTGDHAINGIVVLSGGPFKKKQVINKASVLDVTPTILYLMGLPIAQDMDGQVMESAILSQYLTDHPILRIPTYETEPRQTKLTSSMSPEERKEYLDKFGGIGYLNGSGSVQQDTTVKKK
jgi:predicted AlkP superfamily phosphohydrolase/phosphomutase